MLRRRRTVLGNATVPIAVTEQTLAVALWSNIAVRLAWIAYPFHFIQPEQNRNIANAA
jgi:hypothetical protein